MFLVPISYLFSVKLLAEYAKMIKMLIRHNCLQFSTTTADDISSDIEDIAKCRYSRAFENSKRQIITTSICWIVQSRSISKKNWKGHKNKFNKSMSCAVAFSHNTQTLRHKQFQLSIWRRNSSQRRVFYLKFLSLALKKKKKIKRQSMGAFSLPQKISI